MADGEETDYESFNYVPPKKKGYQDLSMPSRLRTYSKKRGGGTATRSREILRLRPVGGTWRVGRSKEGEGSEDEEEEVRKLLMKDGEMDEEMEDAMEGSGGARESGRKEIWRSDHPRQPHYRLASASKERDRETRREPPEPSAPTSSMQTAATERITSIRKIPSSRPSSPPFFVDIPGAKTRSRNRKAGALGDKSNLPKRSQEGTTKVIKHSASASESGASEGPRAANQVSRARSTASSALSSKARVARSSINVYRDGPTEAKAEDNEKSRRLRSSSAAKRVEKKSSSTIMVPLDLAAIERDLPLGPRTSSATSMTSLKSTRSNLKRSQIPASALGTDAGQAHPIEEGGLGELEPPILPSEAGSDEIPRLAAGVEDDGGDSSAYSSIVVETYERSERDQSEVEVEVVGEDDEGEETIRASTTIAVGEPHEPMQVELEEAYLGDDETERPEVNAHEQHKESPPGIASTPRKDKFKQPHNILHDTDAAASPLRVIHDSENEFVTPGRPMPPRRRLPVPIQPPRGGGPESDEDDLAYYLAITGTGSDDEDGDASEWRKGEVEIGKGVEPGWTIDKAKRRRFILRRAIVCQAGESEDELTLRGGG